MKVREENEVRKRRAEQEGARVGRWQAKSRCNVFQKGEEKAENQ